MAAGMKSDNVGDLCLPGCQHRQRRNKCVTSLTMDEVPLATFNQSIYFWRNVIIALRWPCLNANNAHPFDLGLPGKRFNALAWLSSQQRNADPITRQASSNFMHMRLDSSHVWKIARRYHQYVQRHQLYLSICGRDLSRPSPHLLRPLLKNEWFWRQRQT